MNVNAVIDPETARALAELPFDFSALSAETLPMFRTMMGAFPPVELSDNVERTDYLISNGNEPDIVVRVHRPKGLSGALGCIYWMHGGGLIMGSHLLDDARFDNWCQRFGIVAVSVDYRLAPETPYPGPIEDCYQGLRWVHDKAEMLGVDPTRIGIGGASAGGGLAASLALLARDRGELALQYQLLIYPMIDDRRITVSSQWEVPMWPPASNTLGWTAYLGDKIGTADVSPYAAAARATDLRGLPPALIAVGGIDGFVDEDIDYAARLNRAEVPTELHVYPGAPHGFDGITPNTTLAGRARRDMTDWLAKQLS